MGPHRSPATCDRMPRDGRAGGHGRRSGTGRDERRNGRSGHGRGRRVKHADPATSELPGRADPGVEVGSTVEEGDDTATASVRDLTGLSTARIRADSLPGTACRRRPGFPTPIRPPDREGIGFGARVSSAAGSARPPVLTRLDRWTRRPTRGPEPVVTRLGNPAPIRTVAGIPARGWTGQQADGSRRSRGSRSRGRAARYGGGRALEAGEEWPRDRTRKPSGGRTGVSNPGSGGSAGCRVGVDARWGQGSPRDPLQAPGRRT
jgi:hypothetical protein